MPALRAARQIVRAFSSAILWPPPGHVVGSACPIAVSLTETSALRVRPRRGELLEQVEVRRHGGLGLLDVEGVLAEEVQGDLEPVVDQLGGGVDGGLGASHRGRSCGRSRPRPAWC